MQSQLRRIDLGTMKLIGGYKGIGGSIRSLDVHPHLPYVASCGLDRCVRVHHVESREVFSCNHAVAPLPCFLRPIVNVDL